MLYSNKNPKKPIALPARTQNFDTSAVLAGWLLPAPGSSQKSVYVEFNNLSHVCIDRSGRYRGYWAYTKDGTTNKTLYWLQDPASVSPFDDKSQEDLFEDARLALAVVSCLVARVFTLEEGAKHCNENV